MKKTLPIILFFILSLYNVSFAKIIDNIEKNDTKFGDWTVSCEEDVMMEKVSCKIFSTFYNPATSIYVQPQNKVANQVVIMIPEIAEKTSVKIRVDKNPLIVSNIIQKRADYGVIPLYPEDQKKILEQMKLGKIIFIRFAVSDSKSRDGVKELTAKISLDEFTKVLDYYENKVNNRQ